MKLIHLTDTHLVEPGLRLYGLDPQARLEAAISDIVKHHSDAALTVVTGDLTHWGEPAAYRCYGECVARLPMPVVSMVGNHDRRAACLAALTTAPRDRNGFVQGFRDTPYGRCIFLDTLDERSHAGQMCEQRLGWLAETLAETPPGLPILLFMHHPPFSVGIHEMDRISLAQRAEFAEVIWPYRSRVRHLFFGHVHRPIGGSWQGIPFSTLRGTNHQVWFDLEPDCPHLASHEPPAYGVVLIDDDMVVAHSHDFLDTSRRFPFTKPGADDRAYALGDFS